VRDDRSVPVHAAGPSIDCCNMIVAVAYASELALGTQQPEGRASSETPAL
jgi:hypothetical protein